MLFFTRYRFCFVVSVCCRRGNGGNAGNVSAKQILKNHLIIGYDLPDPCRNVVHALIAHAWELLLTA